MASGITVTSNPDPAQLQSLGVTSWPTWGCGVSTFPWTYDELETCLLLEGDVTVTPDGGEPVRFGAGDLVVFDAGLSCTWDVHAPAHAPRAAERHRTAALADGRCRTGLRRAATRPAEALSLQP